MKAIGHFVEAGAAYDAGRYTRKVMNVNATNALNDGAAERGRIRDVARLAIGRQAAAAGGSGFAIDGSALDAMRESAIEAELDIMTARRRSEMAATGYRTQGSLAYAEGYSKMVGGTIAGAAALFDSIKPAYGGG